MKYSDRKDKKIKEIDQPRGIVVAMVEDERNKTEKQKTRVRQYATDYKGSIIVYIHANGETLKTKEIYKHVFKTYKTVSEVTLVNEHKIKILFGEKLTDNRALAIKEANSLANTVKNSRAYIPAKLAEVQGVISWPVGEDINEFVTNGKGKFNNILMSEVKVLEVTRLLRKSNEAAAQQKLEETGIVIVTFPGQVLPHKLCLDGLIIPVREYRKREMFCENCKRYGHTKKMCNNKKLEIISFLCIQCKTNEHLSGSVNCPRRKTIEQRKAKVEKKLRQTTYAEILKQLDPNNSMPGDIPEAMDVAPLALPTKKLMNEQRKIDKREIQKNKPPSKAAKTQPQQQSSPPGFQKPHKFESDITDSAIDFMITTMNDFNIPPSFQNFIMKYLTPIIDKFLKKLEDTVMQKLCSF